MILLSSFPVQVAKLWPVTSISFREVRCVIRFSLQQHPDESLVYVFIDRTLSRSWRRRSFRPRLKIAPFASVFVPRRHLRSANRHLLAEPRFRLNTYGRRAFSVSDAMAWNSLPDFIRDPASITDCFRRLLKTYLFARY